MKKLLLSLLMICCSYYPLWSQVSIINDSIANSLAQNLAGPGVIVSNAKITGAGYNNTGTFITQNSGFHIKKGIVLSTGNITAIPGSVKDTATTANCFMCNSTDPDLTALAKRGTSNPPLRDVIILEFDVFVTADSLKFNYVFASEEYPDYVCSNYNDVFGFFISGPGITGPFSNNSQNIAIVPGTNLPVAINTINPGVKGINGRDSLCTSLNFAHLYRSNTDTINSITYNGSTRLLSAVAGVIPCNTYRLKLIIGDVGDPYFDSGIFFEAGSLVSSGVRMEVSTAAGDDYKEIVEGCNDGILKLTRAIADTSILIINLEYGGTALTNVDYNALPAQISIPRNQRSAFLNIPAIKDGIHEGVETLVIYILDPCYGNRLDSISINIIDDISVSISNNSTICEGDTANIWANGAVKYSWTPAVALNNPFIKDPLAAPTATTTYTVMAEVSVCFKIDSVTITVLPAPIIQSISDTAMCAGSVIQFFASGGTSYNWSPAAGLNNNSIPNPIASPDTTTLYDLLVTNGLGCTSSKNVLLTVNKIDVTTGADTILCEGNKAEISASGGTVYSWSPATGLENPFNSLTTAMPNSTTTYTVNAVDENGCAGSAEVTIEVKPPFTINIGEDTMICLGKVLILDAGTAGSYLWNNGSAGKTLMLSEPGAYSVTVTGNYGCQAVDTIIVEVENCDSKIFVPTAFSPNGDGINDYLALYEMGGHTFSNIKIFNRWGSIVFETNELSNAWDGGEDSEPGTYIFMLEYRDELGQRQFSKGNITVLR